MDENMYNELNEIFEEEQNLENNESTSSLNEGFDYYIYQINKVKGNAEDEYAIQIENRTKGTKTNFLNVQADLINMLPAYFENKKESN